ncbi:MAG: DUF3300 domain-containing protein [Limisphaerales bacterium]
MKRCVAFVLATLMALGPGHCQTAPAANPAPPPTTPAKKSAAELIKLVEPIALHPDPLIAMILPASAYPIEIVQAARFVKDTNNIPKVDAQPWDENVKGVAKFPQIIQKMDADLAWTVDLGQAFVEQPKEVMDAIQDLRAKAQKVGTLKSSGQQIVTVTNVVVLQTNITEVVQVTKEVIEIAPANPSVIYVPTYPSTIYYPWYPYYSYPAPLVSFGVGFAWGMFWGAAWSHCNWGGGCVDIDIDRNVNRNINRDRNTARPTDRAGGVGTRDGTGRQAWKPDQNRMRQSQPTAGTRDARGWGASGATRPSTGAIGARPSTPNVGARPSTGNLGARPAPATRSPAARPSTGNTVSRPTTGTQPSPTRSPSTTSYGNRSSAGNSAFNRSSGGGNAWSSSYRGSASRGGGGFGGGGGGGGRRGGGRR